MVYYGAKRGPKICNNFRCTFSAPEVPKTSPRRPKMVSRGLRGLPHRVPGWYTMDPNEVQKFSIIFGALFPAPRCPRQAQDGPRWPQEGLVGPSLGSRDGILWIQKMPKNSQSFSVHFFRPRGAQDKPKMAPRGPQEGLVGPPVGPQDGILWIQKRSKN